MPSAGVTFAQAKPMESRSPGRTQMRHHICIMRPQQANHTSGSSSASIVPSIGFPHFFCARPTPASTAHTSRDRPCNAPAATSYHTRVYMIIIHTACECDLYLTHAIASDVSMFAHPVRSTVGKHAKAKNQYHLREDSAFGSLRKVRLHSVFKCKRHSYTNTPCFTPTKKKMFAHRVSSVSIKAHCTGKLHSVLQSAHCTRCFCEFN